MRARLLVLALFAVSAARAADPTVVVKCTRPSHRYRASERAEFDVTSSATVTPVRVVFRRGYLPPLETVVTTTPARVSFGLGEPGFVVCEAQARLAGDAFGRPACAGAGFDPERIRTVLPRPADYDAFWKDAFAEQAAIPPDYRIERSYSNNVQLVSCRTVQGTRMYGFLHLPEGDGPFPLHVRVGGGDSIWCAESTTYAARSPEYAKKAFLFLHLPPWAPFEELGSDLVEHHRRWAKENGTTRLYRWKETGGAKDRWYYRCILGGCRLIEYAAKLPKIDPENVYYRGGSTGGGYGFFLAAFSPLIRYAICEEPNYGNMSGPSANRPSGEDDRGEHWRTSLYYDAAYCAPRITCPVFVSCGYVDNLCVPETVYCTYNELRCPKLMFDKVEHGHCGDRPPEYEKTLADWLEKVK